MTHATPDELDRRAQKLDTRARKYESVRIFWLAEHSKDQAQTLRQLAAEARQWNEEMAG